ncbi:acetate uptake transporter [Bacillus tianshenii]|nr:acetate uptake transporter [Bacillus tianshenii]
MNNNVKIADPGPLGLAAFALTTFILSLSNAQILPPSLSHLFLTLGLFYGGGVQVLAGMWEFRNGNTFAATAFSSYGAFWMSLSAMVYLELNGILNFGADGKMAVGTYLVGWTIFTLYMWIGTFRLNRVLNVTFSFLLVTFILLDLAEFGLIPSTFGGYFGLITAFCAWYGSAAGVLNPLYRRDILPVGDLSQMKKSA